MDAQANFGDNRSEPYCIPPSPDFTFVLYLKIGSSNLPSEHAAPS